jgi:hypothetical protein
VTATNTVGRAVSGPTNRNDSNSRPEVEPAVVGTASVGSTVTCTASLFYDNPISDISRYPFLKWFTYDAAPETYIYPVRQGPNPPGVLRKSTTPYVTPFDRSYQIQQSDLGKYLRCEEENIGGFSRRPSQSMLVTAAAPSGPPTIVGTPTVGSILTCREGTGGPYVRWIGVRPPDRLVGPGQARADQVLKESDPRYAPFDRSYVVQASDAGKTIYCAQFTGVEGQATGSEPVTIEAAPSNPPSIVGTPTVGSTLTCREGTGGPYVRWIGVRPPDRLAGFGKVRADQVLKETDPRYPPFDRFYVVQASDAGKTIHCAQFTGVEGEATGSQPVTVETSGPLNPPSIVGTPTVGSTLTCREGTGGPYVRWIGVRPPDRLAGFGAVRVDQVLKESNPQYAPFDRSYTVQASDVGKTIWCAQFTGIEGQATGSASVTIGGTGS